MTGFLIWTRGSSFLNAVDERLAQDLAVEQAACSATPCGASAPGRRRRWRCRVS